MDQNPSDTISPVSRSAVAVLLLTSIHHAYGAHVYGTPWRHHVVFVAVAAMLAMFGSLAVHRRDPSGPRGRLAWWAYVLTVLAIPVLMIGVFEGLYNHVAKDVLYFAHAPTAWMTMLFPPPTYEMPNDLFFEVTGALHVVPAALTAWYLARAVFAERTHARAVG